MTGNYFNIFYDNILNKQTNKNVPKLLDNIETICENYYKSTFDDMIDMCKYDLSQKVKTIEEIEKHKSNNNKPKCWG